MRYAIAPVAFAAFVAASPVAQGVTDDITPSSSAPSGCSGDHKGTFQIQVVNVTSPAKTKRQESVSGALILTLKGGVLKDAQGRTGYIADNRQFQFDGPAQTGAIYTAGWSVCQNGSLAIGNDAVFQQCLSGTFYNLYDESNAEQCSPVFIEAINGGADSGSAAKVQPDGQPTAAPVNQIADGQPQASTDAVSQISDGQIQDPQQTGAPVSQIHDGQLQAATTSSLPVSQIVDGQIQAPVQTGSSVSPIADGQIHAPVNGTVATPTPQAYTGAAAVTTMRSELFGLAAGILAAAMF